MPAGSHPVAAAVYGLPTNGRHEPEVAIEGRTRDENDGEAGRAQDVTLFPAAEAFQREKQVKGGISQF